MEDKRLAAIGPNPSGLCMCGCGQKTKIVTKSLFWTAADRVDKLQAFQRYFNKHRTHSGLEGRLPEPAEEKVTLNFASYRWKQHCRGLYQTPTAGDFQEFATNSGRRAERICGESARLCQAREANNRRGAFRVTCGNVQP